MNQIENYGDLKTMVQTFIGRRDQTTIDQIPFFINLTEKRVYRNLRIPAFEKTVKIEVNDEGYVLIPKDMVEFKHIYLTYNPQSDKELARKVIALTSNSIADLNSSTEGFSRIGNKLYLTSDIKIGNFIFIVYYADQKELVNDGDTNVMIKIAPDAMLYGTLAIAARFNNDQEEEAKWDALFTAHMTQLYAQNAEMEYSGGALVIKKGGKYFG